MTMPSFNIHCTKVKHCYLTKLYVNDPLIIWCISFFPLSMFSALYLSNLLFWSWCRLMLISHIATSKVKLVTQCQGMSASAMPLNNYSHLPLGVIIFTVMQGHYWFARIRMLLKRNTKSISNKTLQDTEGEE